MLGAIIGDIVGSRFEWDNNRNKDFDFLTHKCFFTDDSVMSLAIAKAILNSKDINEVHTNSVAYMQELGRKYPDAGYGGHFSSWLRSNNPQPYNSWGNGSAMRVSACGFAANSIDEAISLAKATAEVTHNHPEGIKGAKATAAALPSPLSPPVIIATLSFNFSLPLYLGSSNIGNGVIADSIPGCLF